MTCGRSTDMPEFIERKLKKEYRNNDHAIYGTMNKLGLVKGNRETAKGKRVEAKHEKKLSTKSNALRK
jgi:hypothetical protein